MIYPLCSRKSLWMIDLLLLLLPDRCHCLTSVHRHRAGWDSSPLVKRKLSFDGFQSAQLHTRVPHSSESSEESVAQLCVFARPSDSLSACESVEALVWSLRHAVNAYLHKHTCYYDV